MMTEPHSCNNCKKMVTDSVGVSICKEDMSLVRYPRGKICSSHERKDQRKIILTIKDEKLKEYSLEEIKKMAQNSLTVVDDWITTNKTMSVWQISSDDIEAITIEK